MVQNNVSEAVLGEIKEALSADGIEKVVVGAVILIEPDAPLLLKRVGNDFMGGLVELPSGTQEKGETIAQTLVREVNEETGLNVVSIDDYLGSFDYFSSSGKKTRQLSFKVTTAEGPIVLSDEHEAYFVCAVSTPAYQALTISPETKKIIETALA